jgi:hypothetical protein
MPRSEAHEAHRRKDVGLLIKQLRGGSVETLSLAAYYLGHLGTLKRFPH